jgi:glutamyl-tRNA synthetase
MLQFLLVPDAALVVEDDAVASLKPDAPAVLDASATALESLGEWRTADLEAALRAALVDGLGIKPKFAFGPLRVAVTGRRVSPPLFESMEILGRDATLARLGALRDRLAVAPA